MFCHRLCSRGFAGPGQQKVARLGRPNGRQEGRAEREGSFAAALGAVCQRGQSDGRKKGCARALARRELAHLLLVACCPRPPKDGNKCGHSAGESASIIALIRSRPAGPPAAPSDQFATLPLGRLGSRLILASGRRPVRRLYLPRQSQSPSRSPSPSPSIFHLMIDRVGPMKCFSCTCPSKFGLSRQPLRAIDRE